MEKEATRKFDEAHDPRENTNFYIYSKRKEIKKSLFDEKRNECEWRLIERVLGFSAD